MSRLLGLVIVYAAMFLGWCGVGLFMVLAPVRFGNLVHDTLLLFPEVGAKDWGKKLLLRLVGAGLLVFAIRFALGIAQLSDQSG
jgi:hypothetical protein